MLDITSNVNNLASSVDANLSQIMTQAIEENMKRPQININSQSNMDSDDLMNKIGLAIQRQGGQ